MDVDLAIRTRRTIKQFTGAPVPRADLEVLLELACWAPNHRLTEPWRFFAVDPGRIGAFAHAVVAAIGPDAPDGLRAKRDKLGAQLGRLGAFVALARDRPADPVTDREDLAACAAAVQNLMLAATARGIGTFWSTGEAFELPAVRAFLGIAPAMEIVASIWLGIPEATPTSRRGPWQDRVRWA